MKRIVTFLLLCILTCTLSGCGMIDNLLHQTGQTATEAGAGVTGLLGSHAEQDRLEDMQNEFSEKNPVLKFVDGVAYNVTSIGECLPLGVGSIFSNLKAKTDTCKLAEQKARADTEKVNNEKMQDIAENFSPENIKKKPILLIPIVLILLVILIIIILLFRRKKTQTHYVYSAPPAPTSSSGGMQF